MSTVTALADRDGPTSDALTLTIPSADLLLLQACVGFQAKALSDPLLRGRLYELWCRLERAAEDSLQRSIELRGRET